MRVWFSGPRIGFVRPGINFTFGGRRKARPARHAQTSGGFVYVVSRENDHRIKIGSSADPFRRLGELQTGSPDLLSIAYRVPISGNAYAVEARAHEILDRHRGIGEWFAIPVDVAVAAIHAAAYQVGGDTREEESWRPPRISMQTYLLTLLTLFIVLRLCGH